MSTFQKPRTYQEMNLMSGFPPAPENLVNHANQLLGPYNRWSFQNELKLNSTADVWRGNGTPSPFEYALLDLENVTYSNRTGSTFTFNDMVESGYTDGIIALHQGKVIYERYLNGMSAHSLHAWASCSKSMTGVLAGVLEHEGLFDPSKEVTFYLPELKGSGYEGATINQIMDMTTAAGFPEDMADPISENWEYSVAAGWRSAPANYKGAENIYEFLPKMLKVGNHGERFDYITTNTDVLAWLLKRLTNQTLAELMQERIWSRLGAERDAFWIVGPGAVETAGSGLVTTLRDMARFGQMLLQKGYFNGQQIIPEMVVEEIEKGGDRQAFARSAAAGPSNRGYSYHRQWWIMHNENGAYNGLGYGGQILYIDPAAQMVVAKFSSYPTPTPAGNEFYSAMAAIPALGKMLANR